MEIALIQKQVREGNYHWRQHALERSIERNIAESEVSDVILNGSIIEEYPDDKYGPSCLIFGRTKRARPIHVQCSLPPDIWIITVYEPDPSQWVDFSKRKV
jgi:hypothetical protein